MSEQHDPFDDFMNKLEQELAERKNNPSKPVSPSEWVELVERDPLLLYIRESPASLKALIDGDEGRLAHVIGALFGPLVLNTIHEKGSPSAQVWLDKYLQILNGRPDLHRVIFKTMFLLGYMAAQDLFLNDLDWLDITDLTNYISGKDDE